MAAILVLATVLPAQVPHLPGWQLIWQDEFDGPDVDTDKWEVLTRQHSFNNEKQYYLPQQASIVDGKLRITATNQPIADKQYRSARLESWEAFGPGRFEARIKLPTGQGMWPAFWLFPNDPQTPWPTGGEIDILENRGSQPHIVSSAYHWQTNPGPCCSQHQFVFQEYQAQDENGEWLNFHDDFHVYAAEWDDTQIRFYVNGVLHYTVHETSNRPIFDTPKNIILNLAVGGHFGGDPDGTTVFPQYMDIDYVRVWQPVEEVPGDFNGDGAVDAADYTMWRDGLGTIYDTSHYTLWKNNFGAAASGALAFSSQVAVPEPTSLLLTIAAAALELLRRGRQRH